MYVYIYLFLKFLFIFREGKGRRKRGRETSVCGCLLCAPTGDLANNPGMGPDWESNQGLFDSQAGAQPLSHTSQGKYLICKYCIWFS